MKKAEGKYRGVKAITREEAIKMAPEIFEVGEEVKRLWAERDRLQEEGRNLRDEGEKLRAKADRLRAKGHKLIAEGDKPWAKGYKLWTELATKLGGYILCYHPQAINFMATDQDDATYSFIWPHSEIWIYDGEGLPEPDRVEKEEWEESQ